MRSNNPRFANFCLAVLLACPWGMLLCLPIMIVGMQMIEIPDRLAIRTNGQLVKFKYFYPESLTTLEGKAIPRDPDHEYSYTTPSLIYDFDDPSEIKVDGWSRHLNVVIENENPEDAALWYFVRERNGSGLTYFQKYSVPRKKVEGFIGTKGFRETLPPPEERFQLPSYRYLGSAMIPYSMSVSQMSAGTWGLDYGYGGEKRYYTITRNGEWREIDIPKQTVRVILPEMKFRSIESSSRYLSNPATDLPNEERKKWISKTILHARTEDEVLLLSLPQKDGSIKEEMRIKLPEEFRTRVISWVHLPDDSGLLVTSLGYDAEANEDRYRIQRHDADGKFSEPEQIDLKREPKSLLLFSGVPLLIPPAVSGAIAFSHTGLFGFPRQTPEAFLMKQLWPIPVLIGLICGGLILIHARRNGLNLSEQIAYAIFGLIGGVPAVAGYLTHRRWGVRVRCPSCGRDVLLRGEKCSGCATEFPQPELVGTEVFA
ncbi:MAG: DUF4149 domain-containing protein [Planctomycetaceae bacterium]|nr:DUF4149 domain-containing protein [Planctomycetaceae bacterium]